MNWFNTHFRQANLLHYFRGDRAPSPVKRQHESGDDMPYTPPCGDECHSSQMQFGWEYPWVKDQREPQSGVLDAGLDGNGPAIDLTYF